MANPYTKLPGYEKAWPIHLGDDDDFLVLFERRANDPKATDLYDFPWEVRHMRTGKFKRYGRGKKGNAELESAAVARSATMNRWWETNE